MMFAHAVVFNLVRFLLYNCLIISLSWHFTWHPDPDSLHTLLEFQIYELNVFYIRRTRLNPNSWKPGLYANIFEHTETEMRQVFCWMKPFICEIYNGWILALLSRASIKSSGLLFALIVSVANLHIDLSRCQWSNKTCLLCETF